MTNSLRSWVAFGAVLLAAAVLAPAEARAQEKVKVNVDVVHVSNAGTVVDPPSLAAMKEKFAKQGLQFSSYKQLSTQVVELAAGKASEISLPNEKKASFKLDRIEKGTAMVDLSVSGLSNIKIQLGREGAVYQTAGSFKGGQLVLVVAPITDRREAK